MWILYAFCSALFAGLTAVLAKIGIQKINSHLATALRTVVVLVFAWMMVFIVGSQSSISSVDSRSWLFLILSGFATGASWICYFRALQTGDVNKVAPIDKSSTVLTMLLAFLLLREALSLNMLLGMCLIFTGTLLMVTKTGSGGGSPTAGGRWLLWAVLSAVFASLTAILSKIGIVGVESNLGTAIGLLWCWRWPGGLSFFSDFSGKSGGIGAKSWLFLASPAWRRGLSWMFYYRALQEGPASVVVPIDKLSILVTVAFSGVVLKERLSRRAAAGLALLTGGTLLLLVKF